MTLRSAAGGLISRRRWNAGAGTRHRAPGIVLAALVTLVVASPWLSIGYWFGTDWPGPRQFAFPTEISSSYLIQVVLAAIGQIIGGESTGKVFVIGALFVAALAAYEAAVVEGFVAQAVGTILYVVNPFVYGRLHYGQLFLLAAFAILPLAAVQLRRLLVGPDLKTGSILVTCFVLIGILSAQIFLMAAVFAATLVVLHVMWAQNRRAYARRIGFGILFVVAATLGASFYWIIPLLRGSGSEGVRLTGISAGDANTFAAIPDQHLGLIPNLLGLYGFWAEASGRFTSMKDFVPAWPVFLALLLILCIIGAVFAFRHRKQHQYLAPWVAGLLATATLALILEMGFSHPLTTGLVQWLDAHFTPYRGMRDAGKWAAILALAYSQLAGLGAVAIVGWLRARVPRPPQSEWITSVGAGLLLALPLYYGNGLLYGAHGEIKPSQYPPGWYAADRALASDGHPGRALFLPWHLYMGYSFIRNQNKVVAAPAPTFFSVPVLVSANPEVPGITPPTDPDQVAVSNLVSLGGQGHWSEVLKTLGVRYVLVAHEVDWASFRYLDTQAGLAKVGDYGSIVLYRNNGPPSPGSPPLAAVNSTT